ncbi:MAG: gluconokinase [Intrasporangium sp.]|uniref:gluconokinase n=1 Tax=Intrasporangium sp. TaxID=1925024 RepID=UPI002648B178|nr:gluconokinase [Intrasporangium sp.]MDN5794986.1 gluconokinase [Intrasporangium sp.]
MTDTFETEITAATRPLVLALDVGSTASRGAVYDAHGRPVGRRAKASHAFTTSPDGTSVIDPDQIVDELAAIIDELTSALGGEQVAGVAIDTFASSLVVVDRHGRALTPCFTYADGRCTAQVEQLLEELDERALHQRTGTRVHGSYWPARLRWLAQEHPDVVAAATHYVSLGDYVLLQLTGTLATGTSCAAWTGMVDRHTADWDAKLLGVTGIGTAQLAPIHHVDEPLEIEPERADRLAERWPAIAGARWYAAVADGVAANVGLGAGDERSIGASCATSGALRVIVRQMPVELPRGLWCYRVSHDRSIVGGALSDVGRALSWAGSALAIDQEDPDALSAALLAEPCDGTPLVLPFLTGERSTGWAGDARAVLAGVDVTTGPLALYRGVVEGIALAYARIAAQLHEVAPAPEQLYCGGRVTNDRPELLEVMADAMRTPVTPVPIKRSTLHGTALLALESLAPDVPRAIPPHGPEHRPQDPRRAYYTGRLTRFEHVYHALFG